MKYFCKRATLVLLGTWVVLMSVIAATFTSETGQALYTPLFVKLVFANKGYAKHIDVQAYIVTPEQISDIFKDVSQQPIQLTNRELYQKQCYLLVRLENKENETVWGTLSCRVPSFQGSIPINVPTMHGDRYTEFYITALGSVVSLEDPPEELPKVSYRWQRLYVY